MVLKLRNVQKDRAAKGGASCTQRNFSTVAASPPRPPLAVVAKGEKTTAKGGAIALRSALAAVPACRHKPRFAWPRVADKKPAAPGRYRSPAKGGGECRGIGAPAGMERRGNGAPPDRGGAGGRIAPRKRPKREGKYKGKLL